MRQCSMRALLASLHAFDKRTARAEGVDIHLHAYSPMEVAHMCDISGLPAAEVFARLADAGLGSTPGTAAEVLHDAGDEVMGQGPWRG